MIDKTLVILPGWGGSQDTWQEFVDLAKPHFSSVQVVDLPCFGSEPCPNEVWGIDEYAAFVEEKLHGEKDVILLGHSFGGAVATNLLSKHPDLATTLILVGAAIVRPKRVLKRTVFGALAKLKYLFMLPGLRWLYTFARKVLYRAADSPDYTATEGMKRDIYKKITRQDQLKNLAGIQIPVHVIWGTNDKMVPLSYGKRIAAAAPNGTLSIIKDGTHGLHHTKTKQEFLDVLLTKLA